MTTIYQEGEVVVHIWNGTDHDTWHALIRVEPTPGDLHGDLNVYYFDGIPQVVNGMLNYETVITNAGTTDGFDYWSHAFSSDPTIGLSRPWISPAGMIEGDIVWLMIWDAKELEHFEHPAVITAVTSPDENSTLDLVYIQANGTTGTKPNVDAIGSLADVTGEDYWFYRRPVTPLPESA